MATPSEKLAESLSALRELQQRGHVAIHTSAISRTHRWTVIPVERRVTYMQALEQASVHQNIEPFAQFIGYLVGESLNNKPVAKI